MRNIFLNEKDNMELSAKEFHNSISAYFRNMFLVDNLLSSRYDMIHELNAIGVKF